MTNHTRIAALVFSFILSIACTASSHGQAIGDFNNDGFADLAAGVLGEDFGSVVDAGAVNVIYGTASRLDADGSQLWHLNRPGVPEQAASNDEFGSALAAGDFNNDGFDDLAVGIPGRTVLGQSQAGAVLVLFGSASGLIAAAAQYWHQNVAGVLDAAQVNDRFGAALTVGDFDGDGFDDLAIGVPGEDADAGAVNVLRGSADGLTAAADHFFQQGADGIGENAEAGDEFGTTLGSGDFNNDGFDELVVGAPDESLGQADETGVVHVIMGSADGLTTDLSQTWSQDFSGIPEECEDDDGFGASVAAGDFDNDGFDDLAIGVPGESIGPAQQAGGVLILRGGAGVGLTFVDTQWYTQNKAGVHDACEQGDHFGNALTSADFDNDGFADLAVGVSGETLDSATECGAVHILFGANNGLVTVTTEFWHQDIQGILDRCEIGDEFATTLAAGDLNGDGFADLAIGIPDENIGPLADAGAIAVLYSDANGLRAGPDQFWHQNVTGIGEICDAFDGLGGANAD